jgi:hypothetical protein
VNALQKNWTPLNLAPNLTPLHLAVKGGSPPAVKVLLEFGADIDALDEQGMSPLLYACDEGDTEIVRLLLQNGAKVKWPEKDYYTQHPGLFDPGSPLHLAVKWADKTMVKDLLEFGADIDALDGNRMSPLMYTCDSWACQSSKEIIVILLENGADVEVGDWGRPLGVLDYATWKNEGIITMLREAEEEDIHSRSGYWHRHCRLVCTTAMPVDNHDDEYVRLPLRRMRGLLD